MTGNDLKFNITTHVDIDPKFTGNEDAKLRLALLAHLTEIVKVYRTLGYPDDVITKEASETLKLIINCKELTATI